MAMFLTSLASVKIFQHAFLVIWETSGSSHQSIRCKYWQCFCTIVKYTTLLPPWLTILMKLTTQRNQRQFSCRSLTWRRKMRVSRYRGNVLAVEIMPTWTATSRRRRRYQRSINSKRFLSYYNKMIYPCFRLSHSMFKKRFRGAVHYDNYLIYKENCARKRKIVLEVKNRAFFCTAYDFPPNAVKEFLAI